jgi:cell division transport system ATP-binding protein
LHQVQQKDVPFLRRRLGIIFQDFQLLEDRSVAENLSFVLKATGWKDRSLMKNRMSEVLMKVGLDNVMSQMPYQLSGGEQQRIVIARALLNDPVLLIADEPTGNLDPEVSEGIFQVFARINQGGTAVLMATHDYSLIESHPNRTLKCEDKQLFEQMIKPAS